MELLLIKEGVWEAVNQVESSDEDTDNESSSEVTVILSAAELRKLDNKARALIGLMVEDDQLEFIRNETTALGSWKALKAQHEKHTHSNKVHLIRQICKLKLEDGDVHKHMTEMNELFQKLRDINEKELSQSWNVAMLLNSLPKQYDTLITALEAREEKDLTYAFVQQKVLAEYERSIKGQRKRPEFGSVMSATSNDFLCHFCKMNGHFKRDCERYKVWLTKRVEKQNEDEKKREANICEQQNGDRCGL